MQIKWFSWRLTSPATYPQLRVLALLLVAASCSWVEAGAGLARSRRQSSALLAEIAKRIRQELGGGSTGCR